MSCEGRLRCTSCGAYSWVDKFGCALPGCEKYAVLSEPITTLAGAVEAEQVMKVVDANQERLAESIEAAERMIASGNAQTFDELVDQIIEQDKDLLNKLAEDD